MRLERSLVEVRGLQYDRRWMLVDESGRFLSQRVVADMVWFDVALGDAGVEVTDRRVGDSFVVPYEPQTPDWRAVSIWDSRFDARLVSAEADAWFSSRLMRRVQLVFMSADAHREVDTRYAGNGEEVSFADGYPVLLISQASLDLLNSKLEWPVEMARFRPNFVIAGTAPFAEDAWSGIQIGEVEMQIVKPCSRCVMTTLDPLTGKKGPEPLKTLAAFRQEGNKILFGQNVLVRSEGIVAVGDRLFFDKR